MTTEQQDLVIVNISDFICEIRFNRPQRKNALTLAMYEQMATAMNEADQNNEVRVLLFTGAGDAFTAGNDLMDFMKSPPTNLDTPVFRFLKALASFSKPIIAAVNGAAIGIGTTMLLHCDLVYASENAKFQLPFIRLGLVPEAGASLIIPHMLGQRKAAELLMLGESFSATQAQEYGIINASISTDELYTLAQSKAKTLASLPPTAMRQTKSLLKSVHQDQLEAAMISEGEVFMKRLSSPETNEAIQAFFEKRTPDFSQFS